MTFKVNSAVEGSHTTNIPTSLLKYMMAELMKEWPWYCGSFLIGLLIGAVIGILLVPIVTIGLYLAPHDLVYRYMLGDANAMSQIALNGDHDHCCLCGGNAVTWCCNAFFPNSGVNKKLCLDESGQPKALCF